MDGDLINFDVTFDGNALPMSLPIDATIADLKEQLNIFTNVPVNRQMLLNLADVKDDTTIARMDLKNVEMVEMPENEVKQQTNPNENNTTNMPPVGDLNINDIPTTTNTTNTTNNVQPPLNFHGDDDDLPDDDDDYDLNQPYVTSRYATNYFPNTQPNGISQHALTDFMDQLTYPNFSKDMMTLYHMVLPESYQGSYKEALLHARKQGKLVLTYLHHPENESCQSFCVDILQSEEVFEFIKFNYVFYVGNVNEEAESFLMNLIPFEGYPIISVVSNFGQPNVLELMQGMQTKEDFFNKLVNFITSNEAKLTKSKLEEEEKEEQRRLIEEQNQAYEESLKADIEKAKKEEEERLKAEEEQKKIENRKKEKLDRINLVPAEPPKGPTSTQIIFKLPDDSKLERRFNSKDTLQTLFNFLDGSGVEIDNYQLITSFPKKIYTLNDSKLNLEETGIHPQSILFVRDADN